MREMLSNASARFAATTGDTIHGRAVALKELWNLTYREAQVQTFADTFLVIGICLAIATLLVPLLGKVAVPAAPSTNGH